MSNVPKLRFKEFSGEWELKKLEELFVEIKNKVGVQNIETYSISAGIGFVSQREKFGKDISGQQNEKYIVVQPNQFSYNKGNSKTFKYGCIYPNNTGKPIAVPNVFISFDLIDKDMNIHFFAKLFENHYLDRGLRQIISSSARMDGLLNVSKTNFFQLKIPTTSKQEQEKVASFFTSVDTKIQLLIKKEKLLGQYKKGVMQKIFNQEIRFQADDGSEFSVWEEKKLGSVGEFKSGTGFPEKEQGGTVGIPFFKVSDMNLQTNTLFMNEANNYVSQEQIKKLKLKPIIEESIIFAKVGAAIFLERKRIAINFLIDNNMMAFTPRDDINFLYHWVNRIHLSKFAQVGALPSYNASDLKTIKISLPCQKEQEKIAIFLSTIDTKIEQVQNQLKQTKAFKKALLQQMFV